MARLAFKPDSSFFRKIAMGAVGARAVCADLVRHGHAMVELERGSTDTKLWRDVKRKRVRIPDLVCTKCGARVESRTKTDADLSMSHTPGEEARSWDFGMVDHDLIAFPVCKAVDESYWSAGRLNAQISYWHERNRVRWEGNGAINYFTVKAFRSSPPARSSKKGVTEGSETSIAWDATFSTRAGVAEVLSPNRVRIRRTSDGHVHTWTIRAAQHVAVASGQEVHLNQVIASAVPPATAAQLTCPGTLPAGHLLQLLKSRERTLRFTGVKLARLRADLSARDEVTALAADAEEDVYTRLEAACFLCSVCNLPADELFKPYCSSTDEQTQLEAVITLSEAATDDAVELLASVLHDPGQPYFLRSAAAWSLSRVRSTGASSHLIQAFGDVDRNLREEALEGIVRVGGPAVPLLLAALDGPDGEISAGCAESLRQQRELPSELVEAVVDKLRANPRSTWTTWLVGHLPRERVASAIADLQQQAPHLHYALSVLWSFVQSWIARRWELLPGSGMEGPASV